MNTIDYPNTADKFDIRPVTQDNGAILADIYQSNPDTGDISHAPRFRIDAYTAYTQVFPTVPVEGFLATAPDGAPAGAGFVAFKQVRFGGEIRPAGYLKQVAVHPDYRGQGLAKRLAATRIDHTTDTYGDDCLIYAQIQTGNDPSMAVAQTWADSFPYDLSVVSLPPTDDTPDTGTYEVRELRDAELETVVEQVNELYASAELFSPYTSDDLAARLNSSPIDEPLFRYLVVVDGDEVVAGACVGNAHKVVWSEVVDLPPELEEADSLPDSIPDSREIRMTAVMDLWYRPEHRKAGEVLIDAIRSFDDTGNRISLAVDPTGPVGELVELDDGTLDMTVPVRGAGHPVDDTFVAHGG